MVLEAEQVIQPFSVYPSGIIAWVKTLFFNFAQA
jgi:hypothetical protein